MYVERIQIDKNISQKNKNIVVLMKHLITFAVG
jgi:hypothetical protein